MSKVQRSIIAIGVTAIAGFGSVSGAAAKPQPVLEVVPVKPGVRTSITLSFRAPELAPKLRESKIYYGALLTVGSVSTPVPCIRDFPVVAFRAARGGTFTATLNPRTVVDPKGRRWCDGVARVEVRRYGPWPWYTRVLARRHFLVGAGAALQVAPGKPAVTTSITVSLNAPDVKPPRVYYGVEMHIASNDASGCSHDVRPVVMRRVRGGKFTATLKPRAADEGLPAWCDGRANLIVRRHGPGARITPVLAHRAFPVGTGKAPLPTLPVKEVPVKMTVLAGSTITASAAGRPDRSSPVTGTFRGSIPGRFSPNTDVGVNFTTGGLVPSALDADPLCPGTTAPTSFDLAATSPQTLFASGDASTTLILNGAPSQLFGCGPAGPLTGTTTIPLSGHVGPRGLLELQLAGSVGGIPLPGGSAGGLAANLTVNIDLSGKD